MLVCPIVLCNDPGMHVDEITCFLLVYSCLKVTIEKDSRKVTISSEVVWNRRIGMFGICSKFGVQGCRGGGLHMCYVSACAVNRHARVLGWNFVQIPCLHSIATHPVPHVC